MAKSTQQHEEALNALATIVMAARQLRSWMAKKSVFFFAWYYLGIVLFPFQRRWLHLVTKRQFALILAPRSHGKTEAIAKVFILWQIVRNRNVRILLCSKGSDLSIKSLKAVRRELRYNQKLIKDFGAFYSHNNTWQDSQFQVIRDGNYKEATVEAIGILGAVTGGRFDVIILDDIIDSLSVVEPKQRKKVSEYVDNTLIPLLEPDGAVIGVGTRKHFDDIYGSIIKNKAWAVDTDHAIIREPEKYELVELDEPDVLPNGREVWFKAIITGDPGEVLCPERWPMAKLLVLRHIIGSRAFNQEYMNTITDDATAQFKLSALQANRDESRSYIAGSISDAVRHEYQAIIMHVDPSLAISKREAEKADSSYMVMAATGIRPNRHRDLLAIERFRGVPTSEKFERLKTFYRRVMPELCFIESNSFATILIESLIEETDMKIIPHHTDGAKNDLYVGVPGLAALFENGTFSLPYRTLEDQQVTDTIIDEFHSFPLSNTDDIVMCFWIGDVGIKRYLMGQRNLRDAQRRQ